MAELQVRNISKRLGGNQVVDDVSFTVGDGEFFVLVGASGSGKSTLLRIICGLEQPDSGEILIDGQDITRLPARERNLGMVFQDYGLYPNMNVYQNIAYGLEARGTARREIEERVPKAAQMLGLGEMLKRSIVDLSGGEQQRVALARALAKDANAYLFDEPLSNLDPKLRYQARRDIITLHRAKRRPSVYVTHDQVEAFAMADRIAVMARGRLQQVGRTEELQETPANMYVAGFIGSPPMNLVRGALRTNGNGYIFAAGDLSLRIPSRLGAAAARYGKEQVVLGLRPEAILPADAMVEDGVELQAITGEVEDVEELVGEAVVVLKLGHETHLTALFQDDGMTEWTPGSRLQVGIDGDKISLFDPNTEQALA